MDRQYNQNADVQRGQGAALLESVRQCACWFDSNAGRLIVADFGCGPGGNSTAPLQAALAGADQAKAAEVHALMVDAQDDKELWKQLDETLVTVASSPSLCGAEANAKPSFSWVNLEQSFYAPVPECYMGRISLAWSSVAVHWLSKIPSECTDVIVGNQFPAGVLRACWEACAQADWKLWLALRAKEVSSGGRLIVAMPGRDESGDYVAQGAWNVFAEIKKALVRDGDLSEVDAARLATREYWRSEAEVFEPLLDEASDWQQESYWLEKRPCPFVSKRMSGELDAEGCADRLVAAFQGFLSTEFNAALGGSSAKFWGRVKEVAVTRPESMDLHVVMHHLVLRRK